MSGQSQKNTRYVTEGQHLITLDDDIINCDSSSGAILLILPSILDTGLLYQSKKFYINDYSGTSATNNIQVVGTGSNKINDANVLTISTNGASGFVLAVGQNDYVYDNGGNSGGGGSTIVTAPFTPNNSTIIVGDDFQEVAEKAQGQINDLITNVTYLQNNEYKITYFAEINATAGAITKPTGSTILLDQFAGGIDAYVSQITNGQPTGDFPTDSNGAMVDVTSFDASGNFVLSGTPSAYPCALIYIIKISASDYQNLTTANILDAESSFGKEDVANKATDFSVINNTLYPSVQAVNNQIIAALPSNSIYMFSATNSGISGYKSMPLLSNFIAGAESSTSQIVTTSPTLIEEFATPSGYPNTTSIPTGVIQIHYETEKVAGSNNYYSYAEIYKRTSGGTETLIATSDNSTETSVNTRVQVTVAAYLSSIISLATTDRIVVKIYCVMLSSSATIGVYYDNNTDSRLQLPSVSIDLYSYAPIANPTFTGIVTTPAIILSSETASRVAIIDASKNVKSADTATYPSLTELAYVKGVTSAIQTQFNAKLPIEAGATTGVSLTFETDRVYGSIGTPETGNITYTDTNAKLGVTNIVIHNHSVAPTFAANMKKLSGSGSYAINVINYIYVTYINSTEVIYSINQRT